MNPLLLLALLGFDINQILQQANRQRSPAQQYPFAPPDVEGQGRGGTPASETPGYGPTGTLGQNLGAVGRAALSGIMAGAPTMSAVPGAMALGSLMARAVGQPQEVNAFFGALTPEQVAEMPDYAGMFASQDAQSMRDAIAAAHNSRVANDLTGYANYATTRTPAGWGMLGGWGGAPAAGLSNPDMDIGAMSGLGLSGGMGPDTGGRTETGEQGQSGNEGMWARGGAHFATRPTRASYGEPQTGGELAIFMPQYMTRPGLQGRELDVRNALLRAIMSLR